MSRGLAVITVDHVPRPEVIDSRDPMSYILITSDPLIIQQPLLEQISRGGQWASHVLEYDPMQSHRVPTDYKVFMPFLRLYCRCEVVSK